MKTSTRLAGILGSGLFVAVFFPAYFQDMATNPFKVFGLSFGAAGVGAAIGFVIGKILQADDQAKLKQAKANEAAKAQANADRIAAAFNDDPNDALLGEDLEDDGSSTAPTGKTPVFLDEDEE